MTSNESREYRDKYRTSLNSILSDLNEEYQIFGGITPDSIFDILDISLDPISNETAYLHRIIKQLAAEFDGYAFMAPLLYSEVLQDYPDGYIYKGILDTLFEESCVTIKPAIDSKKDSNGNEIVSFNWNAKDFRWFYPAPRDEIDQAIYLQLFDLMNSYTNYRWFCNTTEKGVIEDNWIGYAYVPKLMYFIVKQHIPYYVTPDIRYCNYTASYEQFKQLEQHRVSLTAPGASQEDTELHSGNYQFIDKEHYERVFLAVCKIPHESSLC